MFWEMGCLLSSDTKSNLNLGMRVARRWLTGKVVCKERKLSPGFSVAIF